MRTYHRPLPLAGLLALALLAPAPCSGQQLAINGNSPVSTVVRIIGGKAYVPLADVARALGMVLVKTATGYSIAPAGGAGQDNGKMQGKVGDTLFDGKWRFQVLSWQKADSYTTQYAPQQATITPSNPNNTLVVVNCVLKNGQKETDQPLLSMIHPRNTAVTDDAGQSYPITAFDRRGANPDEGASLLPGAATNLVAIFEVPKSANIKAMVFTLWDLDTYGTGGDDVRVVLAQ